MPRTAPVNFQATSSWSTSTGTTPAVLLARAFQHRGEPTRTCDSFEEAKIAAFELPA